MGDMTKREQIEALLDFGDPEILGLYNSWDKGDCSVVGLVEILLFSEIKKHIIENGEYYNGEYDDIILRIK